MADGEAAIGARAEFRGLAAAAYERFKHACSWEGAMLGFRMTERGDRFQKPHPLRTRRLIGFAAIAAWACVLIVLLGCRRADQRADSIRRYPMQVVCTTGIVADLVRHVGGEHVHVTTLMGPGVDPHLYKPTPGDVRRLTAADAVFYNGLHLEGRLADLLSRLDRWKPSTAVTQGLIDHHSPVVDDSNERPPSPDETGALADGEAGTIGERSNAGHRQPRRSRLIESHGVYDPHVWMDVSLWAECALTVADALARLDPDRAASYRQNAIEYRASLLELHDRCREMLAQIPARRRVLVTAHDAFNYFGAAYDIEVFALQGINTVAEADLGHVNQIINLLVEREIKAVFVESSVPIKNIRALIEGCAARGHRVVIGGELFSDSLGQPGSRGETYRGMIEYNVETIVWALK